MKKVVLAIILVITLTALVLRIKKVNSSESITHSLNEKQATEMGFKLADYMPLRDSILLTQDSIWFIPGSIWIHDAIEQKHILFIFSEYYEKSSGKIRSKFKTVMYKSDKGENLNNLVLTMRKQDTVMYELTSQSSLEYYSFNYAIDDNLKNTMKFYIKKARIIPAYDQYSKVTLDFRPLDSILYVKEK